MKKTIAAILVTILASAGYVMLDKTSADKIDRLESQVSVQQEVIDRYGALLDPLEMHTGCTIPCYPEVGTVVQAYVLDLSRTTTWTTTMTEFHWDDMTRPPMETTTATTTTTTEPYTVPTGTTYVSTTATVRAQSNAPTAPTVTVPPTDTTCTTATTTQSPTFTTPEPTKPTITAPQPTYTTLPYYADMDYYYHLCADVTIREFECIMIGKTLTGLPKFAITLTGKTDREYAGRTMRVLFGDALEIKPSAITVIQPDGTFTVTTEVAISGASVIPLMELRID